MKNIKFQIIAFALIVATAISCNNSSNKNKAETNNENQVATENTITEDFSIAPIVNDYLALKNALVNDNDEAAADAGEKLLTTLKNVDMSNIPDKKHKKLMPLLDDAKVNAEHIGENEGKIDHQREHFSFLSKDVRDMITLFGASEKLYQVYCPMYDDGNGAIWISKVKKINNPYMGQKMSDCGKIQKAFE